MASPLMEVAGVGPQIAQRLMDRFGSVAAVAAAPVERLAEVRDEENSAFRSWLKGYCDLSPEELDQRVFEITDRVAVLRDGKNIGTVGTSETNRNELISMMVGRDITEEKEREAALRESEEKYRALVEQSLQGLVVAQGRPPRLVFVNRAFADMFGYTAAELTRTLHVQCPHALTALARLGRVARERIQHAYVYFNGEQAGRRQQRLERQSHRDSLSLLVGNPELAVAEAKAAIVLFLSALDERQRRLYAGLESLKTGHGGDAYIAELFGLDRHTVARGRAELLAQVAPPAGVRRRGGGRPAIKRNA
jgi:PAS domain-containing protein